MSRCVIFLDPSANGGSTGRAWLWVEGLGQKLDVVLDNARTMGEHFNLRVELGDVEAQCVVLVQEVVETLSDFKETSQGIVIEG